ncbi:hypothetical protein J7T55_013590 [Diaporthe amygdali]|uniref:uncharacterized protein n=1 Tax=Phomopsis amygdali TaxID=1214568 RepID=UPI0022FE4093|nr:uncharacterized protein J7T55_013590 [Diaporthe amygdali]KAJ0119351.1 hypothetical protein J7T55_013590 [Diaporthe amygdali]
MATATKQRQPRLRASCDGCFLAKVKCSKARPICSRCLTCGIECRYSPSSRAGKPKASESSKEQPVRQDSAGSPTVPSNNNNNNNMMYGIPASMPGMYEFEGGWVTPPTSIDGSMSRTHSISSGLAFIGVDGSPPANVDPSMATEMYGPGIPWTPPSEIPASFTDTTLTNNIANDHSHRRSQSYDMGGGTMGWVEAKGTELFAFNQVSTPTTSMAPNCFPSPTVTPHHRQTSPRSKSTPSNSAGGSCTCFTVCLQSLQALHNASSPAAPPFDLVLSLNRKAVEGCAAMLACTRCMRRSGTHTAAMLLATVIGTITSFYKNASQSYFDHEGPSNGHMTAQIPIPSMTTSNGMTGLGVSLGAYTVNSEDSRWLELEILARELRKLEEVYANFREVCSELSEDPEVSKAMLGYLGQNLGSTMQVVTHRKGDIHFS